MIARSRLRLLSTCVLLATWSLATPVFAVPDSTNHWVRSAQSFSPDRQAWGAGALFPQEMPYVPNAARYGSITQMALGHGDIGWIEYGWVVEPSYYKDALPHMFLALRGIGVGPGGRDTLCFVEKSGVTWACREPKLLVSDPQEFPNAFVHVAGAERYPRDALTPSQDAFFYIGYNPGNHAWWVQYKDRWIGYIPDRGRHFPQPLLGAIVVKWYGETNGEGKSCVGMGNGYLGTDSRSARMTNMLYLDSKTGRIEVAEAKFEDTGDWPVQGSGEGYAGYFYTWKGMPAGQGGPFDAFNYGGLGWSCSGAR